MTFSLLAGFAEALGGHYPQNAWQDAPAAPSQPSMPDAATAPVVMAVPEIAVPGTYQIRPLSAIPSATGGATATEVTILGIPLAQSPFGLLIGTYGYLLPLMLVVAWLVIAFWDLIRREDLSQTRTIVWMMVVLVIPFVGPILYYVFGGSPIPRAVRMTLVLGGTWSTSSWRRRPSSSRPSDRAAARRQPRHAARQARKLVRTCWVRRASCPV